MLISLIKEQNIIGAIFIGVVLLFTMGSCEKGCFDGAGEESQVIVHVSDFKTIKIEKNYIIHLVQDSANFVELRGKENLISHIVPKVEGSALSFDDNNSCGMFKGYHENHIYIHFSQIEKITIEGSSNIYSQDTIFCKNLVIENYADMATWDFIVKAERLNIKSQSVIGEMKLRGIVKAFSMYSSGMNHCFFEDLQCKNAEVNHTSIGDIHLFIKDKLDLSLNASGNFYCYGNPNDTIVRKKESENGKLFFVE